jgi:hypothetical protein
MKRIFCLVSLVAAFVVMPALAQQRPGGMAATGNTHPSVTVLDDFLQLPPPFGRGVPMPPPQFQPPSQSQPNRRQPSRPWQNDVHVYRAASDGSTTRVHSFERAGVPTMTRLKDGRVMAAFQNFPENDQANFDRVAVAFSADEGVTWTSATTMVITGMEAGLMRPFDPTLVTLPDGRVRMYFTSNRSPRFEESTPSIYSAISEDGMHYTFEPGVRFGVEGKVVIDCAVCLHQGVFHLFSPDNGTPRDMREEQLQGQPRPSSGTGYHATSKDGLTFERMPDAKIEGSPNIRWLGNVLGEGTTMTFLGTGSPMSGRGGNWMASSTDGTTWTLAEPPFIRGADPGFVRLKDGNWLIVATGEPISERK